MHLRRKGLLLFVLFSAAFLALTIDRPGVVNPEAAIPTVHRVSLGFLQALAAKVPGTLSTAMREAGLLSRFAGLAGIQPRGMGSQLPFRMIFPHAPAGVGGGLSIQSSVILLNNSGANAEGTIFFYRDDGSPMSVETTMGTGSSFDFTLLPGEELRLETLEQRATRTGWIEVLSNIQLAGSGTFSVFQGASFVSEVGIADSPSSTSTLLYVDTTEGKNTGFALCNPNSDRNLDYQIEIRRLDGTVVADSQGSLPPRGQTAQFVTDVNAGLTNFKGVLVISASDEFAVITLRTRGLFFTSFPVAPRVDDVSDDDSLLFARLANGVAGDLRIFSTFQLMNNSDTEATATLRFLGENGQSLNLTIGGQTASEITTPVPANSAVELVSAGEGAAVVGWAQVESSIPLAGGAAFTIVNASSGDFVSEVGIPDSAVSPRLVLFAEVRGNIDTGVALTNIGERPIRVRLNLVGGQQAQANMKAHAYPAAVDAVTEIDLAPGQHLARFASQLFADEDAVRMGDFQGRLEMVARDVDLSGIAGFDVEVPMGGITLRTRGPLLTSLPAAPYVLNFHPILNVSMGTRLAGSSPRTCLNWRQQASERGIRTATIQFDRGRVDLSRLPDDTQFGGDLVAGVPLLGVVNVGSLLFTDVTASSAVFYGPLSTSENGEAGPYNGMIRNLPGDGFEVVLMVGPPDTEPALMPIPGFVQICMDGSLVQLPDQPGPVTVSEEFVSMDMMAGEMNALTRSVVDAFEVESADGPVEIHSVSPGRVQGAAEIEILGSGFASTPAGNRVTVETNSRIEAEVLEASADRLRVRLPHGVARGPLRVEAGGRQSNDYDLGVAFAPTTELLLQNPSRGQPTSFEAIVHQQAGEVAFEELRIDPGNASWVTSGFAVDQILGQLTLSQLVNTPGIPESVDVFDLRVIQSGSGLLQVGAFESGDDEPTFLIDVTDGGNLVFSPAEINFTAVLLGGFQASLRFDQAVMMLPGSGSSVSFGMTVLSQPERLARPGTRRIVEQTQQAAIN